MGGKRDKSEIKDDWNEGERGGERKRGREKEREGGERGGDVGQVLVINESG